MDDNVKKKCPNFHNIELESNVSPMTLSPIAFFSGGLFEYPPSKGGMSYDD